MEEAVRLGDLEMVRWLAVKFPGFRVVMEVMEVAATSWTLDFLQFFYDHNTNHQDTLRVAWVGNYLAAGVRSQNLEIVEWLYAHGPSEERKLNQALEAAVCCSNIPMAEWLLAHGATWQMDALGLHPARDVIENSGNVDMLQWLDEQGQLDCINRLGVKAASGGFIDALANGHLEIAKYLHSRAGIPTDRDQRALPEDERMLDYKVDDWNPCAVMGIPGQTMFEASKRGFLDVVQWLYKEFGDYPDLDMFNYREMRHESAMDAAAANGQI